MADTQLKKYEIMLILAPDQTDQAREKALDDIKKLLTAKDGKIEAEATLGLRDLAYAIQKNDRGYYIVMHVWHDPQNLKELEKEFKLDKAILRHLLVAVPDDAEIVIYEEREEGDSSNKPVERRVKADKKEEKTVEEKEEDKKKDKVEDTQPEKEEEQKEEISDDNKETEEEEVKEESDDEDKEEEKKPKTKEELDEVEKKLNEIIEGSDINL